jgi:hypothetical protein
MIIVRALIVMIMVMVVVIVVSGRLLPVLIGVCVGVQLEGYFAAHDMAVLRRGAPPDYVIALFERRERYRKLVLNSPNALKPDIDCVSVDNGKLKPDERDGVGKAEIERRRRFAQHVTIADTGMGHHRVCERGGGQQHDGGAGYCESE